MIFDRVNSKDEILKVLFDFQEVFPHLHEKISDMNEYADKLNRYANVFLGREEERVFGLVIFYSNDMIDKTAYISLIGVKSSARGMGRGQWLFDKCIEYSQKQGMRFLKLEVDLDNQTAIRFYQKNGMRFCENTERDSVYLIREI